MPRSSGAKSKVVRLRPTASEHDAVVWASAEQFTYPFACILKYSPGAAAEFVLAGWIQIRLAPAGAHCFDDFRENRRRGVVVEVDVVGGICGHSSMIQRRMG